MALTKEQILALTYLKNIGPKKILSIADAVGINEAKTKSAQDVFSTMRLMKDKIIRNVALEDFAIAMDKAKYIITKSLNEGIGLVGYFDDDFPENLRHAINEDGKEAPPLILWYRGNLSLLKMPGLAIIGTREPTQEGIAGGKYLSHEFAKRGLNIISGLAIGCDTCGHQGALEANGKTTAILATGLDFNSIYPECNVSLARHIIESGGLLISECSIGKKVTSYALVARDRLQAGLAIATLVIQTTITGGTMHAANTTLKSNKQLYVMKFKNDSINNEEKCLGNALLVEKGALYISGRDNLDNICENILDKEMSAHTYWAT